MMYDELYVLPSELPTDASSLKLRNCLLARGIVKHLRPLGLAERVSTEIESFLANIHPHRRGLPYKDQVPLMIGTSVRSMLGADQPRAVSEEEDDETSILLELLQGEVDGTLSHWWLDGEALRANPIVEIGSHLYDSLGYFSSGAVMQGASHLRTFVYWRTSAHLGLPFHPSYRRLPQYEAFCRHVQTAVQDNVYQAIALAFGRDVEEVYASERNMPIFLPPATALFLDRLRATGDIAGSVIWFRKEFSSLRVALKRIQADMVQGKTIAERQAGLKKLAFVLEGLAGQYGDARNKSTLESLIDYAPEVISPLLNPMDPGSYSAKLILQPAQWIRDWWQKRPFRAAFEARDLLAKVEDYQNLVPDVLGISISPKEFTDLRERVVEYSALYGMAPADEGP
jgi:hypothetical protein